MNLWFVLKIEMGHGLPFVLHQLLLVLPLIADQAQIIIGAIHQHKYDVGGKRRIFHGKDPHILPILYQLSQLLPQCIQKVLIFLLYDLVAESQRITAVGNTVIEKGIPFA